MEGRTTYRMPTTHWSLVRKAGMEDQQARREALAELLRRYMPALRAYLVRVRRLKLERAEDLLQGFVADKILEQELFTLAAGGRGRFRNFLLASLNHYVVSQWRKESAGKRGGGAATTEDMNDLCSPLPGPDAVFDAAWARALLSDTLERMQAACADTPGAWQLFSLRLLPLMQGEEPAPYSEVAQTLGLRDPQEAANRMVAVKRLYTHVLREAVGVYEGREADIQDEIRELREALSRGGGG